MTPPTSPEFIWKIFNNRLHSIIASNKESNNFELLKVGLLRVNQHELKQKIVYNLGICPTANAEAKVRYVLSLHVLHCYRRELGFFKDATIYVDDTLREFISSQCHNYFYLNNCK